MDIFMHEIKHVGTEDHHVFVQGDTKLIATNVVFWISGIWRKGSWNWRFNRKMLYNLKIFNWDFDGWSQAGGFRGGRVGTLRRLNTTENIGSFPQPGLQIRCNRQTPWMVEMNGLSQI